MSQYDEDFVQWAKGITGIGGTFEEDVGARLGMMGMFNAISKLAPAGLLNETQLEDHAIAWVANELVHSSVSSTHDQARMVQEAAETFIRTTLA